MWETTLWRSYSLFVAELRLKLILNSVPSSRLILIFPSSWSTRMPTNYNPSDSARPNSMFSGIPFPLSEIIRLKRDSCVSSFSFSLQSWIRISPPYLLRNVSLEIIYPNSLASLLQLITIDMCEPNTISKKLFLR